FARRTGVRSPNECLFGFLVEPEVLEPPVERLRRELQELHGAPLVSLGVLERAQDETSLELLDRLLQRTRRTALPDRSGRAGPGPQVSGQALHASHAACRSANT